MNLGVETVRQSLADRIRLVTEQGKVNLPPLPALAVRVQEMLERDDADPRSVADLIRNDPAVVAAILSMANSAAYGGLRQLSDPQQAISRLGLRKVAAVVTALVVRGHFETKDATRLTMHKALWDHAVATAMVARRLTAGTGRDPEEAFLAGLLHDVGRLIVLKGVDHIEAQGEPGAVTTAVLDELMALLHTDLGYRVLAEWHLPPRVCDVALHHHDEAPPDDRLLDTIVMADAISRKLGAHPHPDPELDLVQTPAADRLGLSDLELAALMVDVEDEFLELKKIFG